MAQNSKIEWTHHTFNPWWGCLKVSPACKHCYAESWAKRTGHNVWGATTERRFFGRQHWNQPLLWAREARRLRQPARVFCASMADVFEDREALKPWRDRLWRLIDETPELDWLLLTKRIHLAKSLVPWRAEWPSNVWVGTTVEDAQRADERLPFLLDLPAQVRFVSCEPLLGSLDLAPWIRELSWVIAGGETGGHSRPSDPLWFRELRDQCVGSGVAFHFKQWGDWFPLPTEAETGRGRTWESSSGELLVRAGRKKAGRLLDGRSWDEVPEPRSEVYALV